MKKCVISLLCIVLCLALVGCKSSQPAETEPLEASTAVETAPSETAAPVFENFVGLSWTRDAEDCTETICFLEDGGFRYSCSCGNPVNDADLCEGYTYDEESKLISLTYEEVFDETISQISVESCDGQTLVLNFAGDVRTFQLAEN